MKYYGDIELVNGKIINLVVDPVDGIPSFVDTDEARIVYNLNNTDNPKGLYINNGTEYVPFQIASQNTQPLIETLGTNWINPDYSFNPSAFNALEFISGLTSNDNLFSVIAQIDEALGKFDTLSINDIETFSVSDPKSGDIIYFDGTNFINTPLSNLPNFGIDIALGNITDVDIATTPTDNQTIFFDHTLTTENAPSGRFTNKKWAFAYQNLNPQTTHVVTHSLGQRYCAVTVINTSGNTSVVPTSISYDSNAQLTVNLGSSLPVVILVTTIPIQNF